MQCLLTSCLAVVLATPAIPPVVIETWKTAWERSSLWMSGETVSRGLDRTRELVCDGWNAISYSRPIAKTRAEILVGCDAQGFLFNRASQL